MVYNRFNPSGLFASMSVCGLNDGEEEKKDEGKVKRERYIYIYIYEKEMESLLAGFFLACQTYKLLIFLHK